MRGFFFFLHSAKALKLFTVSLSLGSRHYQIYLSGFLWWNSILRFILFKHRLLLNKLCTLHGEEWCLTDVRLLSQKHVWKVEKIFSNRMWKLSPKQSGYCSEEYLERNGCWIYVGWTFKVKIQILTFGVMMINFHSKCNSSYKQEIQ